MLTKSLRPLPEKWHGLKDPDLQQRQRYLHLATDLDYRRVVEARATVLRTIRSYLDERGFVEVETPVLQTIAGGAMARPFVTHHEVLDIDLYLRISLELYLKRLLVGGLERVYEIGHNFRNEGIDRSHNPEFTMLELYQAYADYETVMEITRELVQRSALEVNGSLEVDVPRRDDRSRGRVAPDHGARQRVGGGRGGGHARAFGSRGSSPKREASRSIRRGRTARSCSSCSRSSSSRT